MHSLWRTVALVLALFAMLLRAAVPEGWMPGTDTGAPLMICTGVADMRGMPLPLHGDTPANSGTPQQHRQLCFAAIAQVAAPAAQGAVPFPTVVDRYVQDATPIAFVFAGRLYRLQSPRAPPLAS